MRVLIVGAGQVGRSVAGDLSADHDVVVVERDPERLERIQFELDVLAVRGNGLQVDLLREAGVEGADMVIASTSDDRTNILVCAVAKMVADPYTIARVAETEYLETWQFSRRAFGVDLMVGSDFLTARSIVRVIGLQLASDVELFAHGLVEMAEFQVPEDSPVSDRYIRDVDVYDDLTFAALIHEDRMELARGDSRVRAGDRLVVIGTSEGVHAFAETLSPGNRTTAHPDTVIFGGGEIGLRTARMLEQRGIEPRLVEKNEERAKEIAEQLPDTLVLVNDATRVDFLKQERIDRADVVISALRPDERNLMGSLLVGRLGDPRVVSVVHDQQYVDLFESQALDASVNPREEVSEEITRVSRQQQAENIAILAQHQGEVLEMEATPGGVLTDKPIEQGVRELPDEVVIGAIARDGRVIVPRGQTVIEAEDHVILLVRAEVAEDVSALL